MKLDETFLPEGAVAPESPSDQIQVGAFQPRSLVAGPGTRAVLWVAGCLRRCPACMKPDLFSFATGSAVTVDQMANRILNVKGLDGVTFSGGEPFEQATALAQLSAILRAAGLSVLVYSGYRLEDLRAQEKFSSLLQVTDVLIDGEYRHDLSGPLRWRGSANQRVHILSGAESVVPHDSDLVCEVQAVIASATMRLSGFPSPEIERKLSDSLALRGVVMRPADLGDAEL